MEPLRERQEPTRPVRSQSPAYQPNIQPTAFKKEAEVSHEVVTENVRKNYSREICVILGVTFVLVGLLGFIIPYFLDAHLSYSHNVILVVTGALSIWFGVSSQRSAKLFCYIFGAIYSVVGLIGFFAGVPGIATVANPQQDSFLWNLYPGVLEFGFSDHMLHFIVGVVFLIAGFLTFTRREKIERP